MWLKSSLRKTLACLWTLSVLVLILMLLTRICVQTSFKLFVVMFWCKRTLRSVKCNVNVMQIQWHAYHCGPPDMFVLWWMSFHVMTLFRPVVTDRPMVKMSFLLKAFLSSFRTFSPSSQAGRKAVREVLLYLTPGFGCSGFEDRQQVWFM